MSTYSCFHIFPCAPYHWEASLQRQEHEIRPETKKQMLTEILVGFTVNWTPAVSVA